jgi:hypothetical protein
MFQKSNRRYLIYAGTLREDKPSGPGAPLWHRKYLTWTNDNLLRQVVYEGLRKDKPAAEVRRSRGKAGL